MKVIIFGSGGVGIKAKEKLESKGNDVIAFVDNDNTKWGKYSNGKVILNPNDILKIEYDVIAIGVYKGVSAIKTQLIQMGISEDKIIVPIEPSHKVFICPKKYTEEELLMIPEEEYYSETTKDYLKQQINVQDKAFISKLDSLKECLYKNRIPRSKVCIVSGAVLQAYNLRPSKKFDDIDIIMTSDLREIYGKGLVIVSESVEMHPENENIDSDDEIINNINKHFIFHDLKFMTLKLLYENKCRYKEEKKIQEEVQIIENYFCSECI